MSSDGCNGNLSEGASVEVLGDALAGYIVNVVREKGEEAVRIPPSISAKLKAHQVFDSLWSCFSGYKFSILFSEFPVYLVLFLCINPDLFCFG